MAHALAPPAPCLSSNRISSSSSSNPLRDNDNRGRRRRAKPSPSSKPRLPTPATQLSRSAPPADAVVVAAAGSGAGGGSRASPVFERKAVDAPAAALSLLPPSSSSSTSSSSSKSDGWDCADESSNPSPPSGGGAVATTTSLRKSQPRFRVREIRQSAPQAGEASRVDLAALEEDSARLRRLIAAVMALKDGSWVSSNCSSSGESSSSSSRSMEEALLELLESDPKVRSVFPPTPPPVTKRGNQSARGSSGSGPSRRHGRGPFFVKPGVELALSHLSRSEVVLLKLMVAAGQEHLLDLPAGWLADDDDVITGRFGDGTDVGRSSGGDGSSSSSSGGIRGGIMAGVSGVRGALTMLGSMIEGWDAKGKQPSVEEEKEEQSEVLRNFLKSLENPGVFPTPVMDMVDWEGRLSPPPLSPAPSIPPLTVFGAQGIGSDSSEGEDDDVPWDDAFLAEVLRAWGNPGVFPVPILEMFDIEGRRPEGSDFLGTWLEGEAPGSSAVSSAVSLAAGAAAEAGSSISSSSSCGGSGGVVEAGVGRAFAVERLRHLLRTLERMERFYDGIGGILGYQLTTVDLIRASEVARRATAQAEVERSKGKQQRQQQRRQQLFSVPPGADLASDHGYATAAAFWGLQALPSMAEIWPLGGAGDRLGLVCERTGVALPVAMLPYCGRSLLEGLVRDLQAREYLHFRVFGERHVTPVAIMTSAAKRNDALVRGLCEERQWFGRGRDNFFIFEQPLVPAVVASDGRWLSSAPLRLVMKPGGHGVMWKLASDAGVLDWLANEKHRKATLVRQISNPLASTDVTLLALSGVGIHNQKRFGFASCDRNVGTAEGVNVLREERTADGQWRCGITCVEYTEFDKLGIVDTPVAPGSTTSQYPANTNVLFADLQSVMHIVRGEDDGCGATDTSSGVSSSSRGSSSSSSISASRDVHTAREAATAAREGVEEECGGENESCLREGAALTGGLAALPGMILNLKKNINFTDHTGRKQSVRGGRLECTMQNIADSLTQTFKDRVSERGKQEAMAALDTFLVYNDRRKVTSSAKRRRKPGELSLHQTPEGSFLDLTRNSWELLTSCGVKLPLMESNHCYVETGPPFIAVYHPALGPLWDIIRQKIRGGSIAEGAEVGLEIAELAWNDVHVDGSLLVEADSVMGCFEGRDNARSGERGGGGAYDSESVLQYGLRCGRCRMENVTVRNGGVDWHSRNNVHWQRRVQRRECCRVVLHEDAEFYAHDCIIEGSRIFEVPAGHRMIVTASAHADNDTDKSHSQSGIAITLEPMPDRQPSWMWHYLPQPDGFIELKLVETTL